ncbi:two-component system sensor histidine kinase TctE [Litoreibacter ponti]|uniref:histidine kinase n=1 Tax=Litoreibacter ponti TaxID=1510457 RepID=A0A2T6BEA6_9RHOB|nr:sensor histidine kinase [Litoreibacter ponti]PTX54395.1 two-component system sensor histidine kinase TctE [Litoreibacter ponti]
MSRALSLRARLTVIILLPVLSVALLAGLWQLGQARGTAADVFNRSLLSAALAVSNDVAISGGDALSERTRDILASTSGGLVFYHVFAPDGVIVAGYATPPVGIPRTGVEAAEPTYFDAIYLGRSVSGVRLQTRSEIDGVTGLFTTTVWQDRAVRVAFVRDLVLRTVIVMSSLLLALGFFVWFGVRVGLRPLLDLEQAIAQRSPEDLSPIKRAVPDEVAGIVATLNRLFGQVSHTMSAQSEFIANAAHQLRNPIAGVLALAEAVVSAKSPEQTKARAGDLLKAAETTADLSQKLLLLERAEALPRMVEFAPLDLSIALRDWLAEVPELAARGVSLELDLPKEPAIIVGDPVMLREACVNLIDNALRHGGADLSRINVRLSEAGPRWHLTISDDGRGIADPDRARATERFVQLAETGTTGLGLSIVRAIVEGHGGSLTLYDGAPGLRVGITLPQAAGQGDG